MKKTMIMLISMALAGQCYGFGFGGSGGGRVNTSTPYTFTATQTAPEWTSSSADNTHYLNVNNSTSHKSSPSTGDIDTIAGLPWIYNGSWVRILLAGGTMTDTKYCTYSSSGGGLICNSEGGSGGGLNSGSQYHLVWYPSTGTTGGDSGIIVASDGSSITTVQGTTPDILGLRPGSAAGTNYVGFKGPATNPTASWTMQFPAAQPTNGQILVAGTPSNNIVPLSWSTPSGSMPTEVDGNIIYGASSSWTVGTALPNGITATTQSAQSNDTKLATNAYVDTAVPFFYSGSSITIARENAYAVCTANCTVTPPAPAAGKQFCVRNAPGGSYTISLAALGSGNYYEKTDHSGYGTANATFTATAATTNQVCFVGLDANHYLLMSSVGTWTAN